MMEDQIVLIREQEFSNSNIEQFLIAQIKVMVYFY